MKEKLIPMSRFKTQVGEYQKAQWTGTNESGWEPLGEKVIIYPDQAPEMTSGGIHITADIAARHTMAAEAGIVVAKGPDVNIQIELGDRVFVERFGGQLAPGHDGKIYRVMEQAAIGAVYKPKEIK